MIFSFFYVLILAILTLVSNTNNRVSIGEVGVIPAGLFIAQLSILLAPVVGLIVGIILQRGFQFIPFIRNKVSRKFNFKIIIGILVIFIFGEVFGLYSSFKLPLGGDYPFNLERYHDDVLKVDYSLTSGGYVVGNPILKEGKITGSLVAKSSVGGTITISPSYDQNPTVEFCDKSYLRKDGIEANLRISTTFYYSNSSFPSQPQLIGMTSCYYLNDIVGVKIIYPVPQNLEYKSMVIIIKPVNSKDLENLLLLPNQIVFNTK